MSDVPAIAIEPADTVAALIREMVHGDLLLRHASLSQIGQGSCAPAILFAREMRGKLNIALSLTGSKKILFFFKTGEATAKTADVRIRFALVPSMTHRHQRLSLQKVELEPPLYLADSGDANRLHLHFAENSGALIHFHADDTLSVHMPNEEPSHSLGAWPLSLTVTLIKGIADQARSEETGSPRPFVAPVDPILNGILERVVGSYRATTDALHEALSDPRIHAMSTRLQAIHPDLGGHYRFSELFSRVLVWVGKDGALVSNLDDSDGHQLDVEARILPINDNYALRYKFRIPDLLVSGEYHRRFVQAVCRKNHASSFRKIFNSASGKGWGKDEFQAFLAHPNQERAAIFIRTRRGRRDRNLVLLCAPSNGRLTEMLFEADFDVEPYPDVSVNDIDVKRLFGYRFGTRSKVWQETDREGEVGNLPQQYMINVLHTLRGWQSGTTSEVFH